MYAKCTKIRFKSKFFRCFFVDPIFRVCHEFFEFLGGLDEAKPPRNFWRIFRLFFNIFVSVKLLF
eukprot:UN28498